MHVVALVLALGCVTGGACAHRPAFSPADRHLIEAVLEQQRQAWNRGDLPGYMAGYARTPELVFTSGGRIRRGWEATLTSYQRRYGSGGAGQSPGGRGMGQLVFEVLGVQAAGADAAVMLGRWTLTDTPQAGSGLFSVVFERRPEGWRIIHDHTSANPRRPRADRGAGRKAALPARR